MTKQAQDSQAAEMFALSERLQSEGDKAEAEVILQRIIETFPEFDPAYHALGLMAYETGKLELAAELLKQAISFNPLNGLYHRNFGELCRRLGRLEEAVVAGRQASELIPRDVDTHFNLGLAFSDFGHWPEAIAANYRALALQANHGLAWNNLGVALVRSGRRTEALQAFLKATQSNSNHLEAQLNLAVLYKQAGLLTEARRCLALVQGIAPGFAEKQSVSINVHVASIDPPAISVRDTSSARGRGGFAERSFLTGQVVETAPVVLLHTDYAALPPQIKTYIFNWGDLCGIGNAHALALGYGSLYNHDNPANLRYEADPENLSLKFIATRNIAEGDELTINYNNPCGTDGENDSNWFTRMNIKPIYSSSKRN